ncbi:MAG: PTS sugar transporter subunit IIA [Spirochaetales bacterium]|nr:PTS sugar transporter subunit IIA [Spirochaetales bacterium]
MSLLKYLTLDTVTASLAGAAKPEVIESLLDIIVRTGKVHDRAAALDALLTRERKLSTGMENGIAIPHGKTDTVSELVAAVGITPAPVDFDAQDRQPCRIFIMTLSPSHRTGPHIQFLAEISDLLRSESLRARLLTAKDGREIIQALTDRL